MLTLYTILVSTLEAAKPEKAKMVENIIIQNVRMGSIQGKIDDEQFKGLLSRVSEQTTRQTKVKVTLYRIYYLTCSHVQLIYHSMIEDVLQWMTIPTKRMADTKKVPTMRTMTEKEKNLYRHPIMSFGS